MKTFKTIEDYKKYMKDFVDTFRANNDFMVENGITMLFSSSINEEAPDKQIIFGEPALVGANLCLLIRHLPKGLAKEMYKALKKEK